MLKLKYYWSQTSPQIKKLSLWLKSSIGVLALSAYAQSEVKAGFYLLIAGALIDGILQLLPPDQEVPKAGKAAGMIAILVMGSLLLNSCSVIKPGVDHSKMDTTITSYKQVDISLKGAKVVKGLNMDSLFKALLFAKDQRMDDSVANLKLELQYKQDSIVALKAGKQIPQAPVFIKSKPVISYVTDPQTKAQLSYWIDAYGKLQLGCESKDQVMHTLQAQVTKLTKDTTKTIDVAYQTPVWAKVVMIIEAVLLVIAILIIVFKSLI